MSLGDDVWRPSMAFLTLRVQTSLWPDRCYQSRLAVLSEQQMISALAQSHPQRADQLVAE